MPSQKMIDDLEAIIHRNKAIARRDELFKSDPTCDVCTKAIERVEDCSPVRTVRGEEFLVHNDCSMMMFQQMATRFFQTGKAR